MGNPLIRHVDLAIDGYDKAVRCLWNRLSGKALTKADIQRLRALCREMRRNVESRARHAKD